MSALFDALTHAAVPHPHLRASTSPDDAPTPGAADATAVGLHPARVDERWRDAVDRVEALLDAHAALGECGLDHRAGQPDRALQALAFDAQLALAKARRRPVVVHLVRAAGRGLELLAAHAPLTGFVHGFAGPAELVPHFLDVGLHLSFGGLVLNPRARRCRAACPLVPRGRLLVETDAPDLPPEALLDVVRAVADLRGEDTAAVAEATADNARALLCPAVGFARNC